MARFDVHRNPGRTNGAIPYLVVVPSRQFDDHVLRLVAPLLRQTATRHDFPALSPRFEIEGLSVVLDPLQLQSVAARILGAVIASLADDNTASVIITAIDEVISRARG